MSAYFDNHKDRYIDYMFEISTEGKWEEWIRFCLEGVISQTKDAEVRCEKFIALSQDYSHRIEKIRGSNRLNLINNSLFNNPVVLIPELANRFGVTYPTSKSDVEKLIEAGILHELDNTDQRTFFAPEIFRITYED
jgi:Fic family protein